MKMKMKVQGPLQAREQGPAKKPEDRTRGDRAGSAEKSDAAVVVAATLALGPDPTPHEGLVSLVVGVGVPDVYMI